MHQELSSPFCDPVTSAPPQAALRVLLWGWPLQEPPGRRCLLLLLRTTAVSRLPSEWQLNVAFPLVWVT